MKVFRSGDHLAVQLPAALVEDLGLGEGDEVEIGTVRKREPDVPDCDRIRIRAEAIEALRRDAWALPPGFRFDREDANQR